VSLEAKYIPEPNSGCWIWTAALNRSGYGQFRLTGQRGTSSAHRVVYEAERGPIPNGMTLDHLCRNRCCVNPDHLEPVTHRENVLRSPLTLASINAGKTHCQHGHEFTAENTYTRPRGRMCRECHRLRSLRDRARSRARKDDHR
jgi:hypothetical protein